MLYSHVPYHNGTIINRRNDKDTRRIKTQEDFFIKYLPLTLFVRVQKGCSGLRVRESWRSNITEIFWPQTYDRQRCVFLFHQGCSTVALESTLLGDGFPYYNSSFSAPTLLNCPLARRTQLSSICSIRRPYITFKLPRSDMDTPPHLRNFFRYLAIGMCHFRYLWNGLCDRHRAEITVMQFRGHSLPVRQSMRV